MNSDTQHGEMHDRLIDFQRQNLRESLGHALLRYVEDPLKPRGQHGRFRVNPILLLLALVFALAFGMFLFLSVIQS